MDSKSLTKDSPLHQDIPLLVRMLGDMVRVQEGEIAFQLIEDVRRSSGELSAALEGSNFDFAECADMAFAMRRQQIRLNS